MWYFWATNTQSWSNSPPKQVLSPIARFSNLWNASLVFDLWNMLFFVLAPKVSQVWYFWSTNTKSWSNAPPKQFLSPIALVLATYGTQVRFSIYVICFLCFSAKSISSVVLLVNKHQKLDKCPTKTSFKPNCSF